MVDPVITRRCDYRLGMNKTDGRQIVHRKRAGLCYCAVISRDGHITHGIVKGFARELDGIAASNTASMDIVVLGQDVEAMRLALRRILALGGGMAVIQKGSIIAELALPLGGSMNPGSMTHVIEASEQIERVLAAAGYPHHETFYTLRFLSSTHLPSIRLTRDGIVEVKPTILRLHSRLAGAERAAAVI